MCIMSEEYKRKLLNIDNLWDIESIDERLHEFGELRDYANDWFPEIKPQMDILNERKRTLEK